MIKINYSETKLLGIFGHPLKQTFSPMVHNKAIELLDLDYVYLPFNVGTTALPDAIKGVLALGIKGLNVTIPHKETILNHLADFSDEAAMIGSVNTVVNDMGKLIGYNTDVHGFHETLLPYSDKISGEMVTIIGAGGAARAAIYCLIRHFRPSKIVIVNRTEQRAHTLKRYFTQKMKFDHFLTYELFPPDIATVINESALIVNATPVGM
ncbi:MAG: shikimate dehydrogenase, partial [Ignavibacteriaceae bacterium]|nr:shikimate dehydrogenase [Ignavibacteriaceae bacterium]